MSTQLIATAHIHASLNNTIITITNPLNKVIACGSCGTSGFKGMKRSSAYAAQITAEMIGVKAHEIGVRSLNIKIKGFGKGREASIKGLRAAGLLITTLQDVTPIPHNGCRPSKLRRI